MAAQQKRTRAAATDTAKGTDPAPPDPEDEAPAADAEADTPSGTEPAVPVAPVALTIGATGDAVLAAQRKLNAAGRRTEQNGRFTPAMAAAVRSFQARHGLDVNGTLDAATLDALDS